MLTVQVSSRNGNPELGYKDELLSEIRLNSDSVQAKFSKKMCTETLNFKLNRKHITIVYMENCSTFPAKYSVVRHNMLLHCSEPKTHPNDDFLCKSTRLNAFNTFFLAVCLLCFWVKNRYFQPKRLSVICLPISYTKRKMAKKCSIVFVEPWSNEVGAILFENLLKTIRSTVHEVSILFYIRSQNILNPRINRQNDSECSPYQYLH